MSQGQMEEMREEQKLQRKRLKEIGRARGEEVPRSGS